MEKILIIDDDHALARTLKLYFQSKGFEVTTANNAQEGIKLWQKEEPDLVLLDVQLPDMDGPRVLAQAKEKHLKGDVIMITAFQDTEATLTAIRLGAVDYLYKPLDLDALDLLLEKIILQKKERGRIARLSHVISETFKPHQIVGRSSGILHVIKSIAHVSGTPTSVLIEGETGTGKELVARTIHHQSSPEEPFVGINCAAIVRNLLESELFGYEKGAFTGASRRKIGKLEYAAQGTVFLDEISELPMELQTKFLRVLQEREFQRVGGIQNITFHARIIAATNSSLDSLVKKGSFREDLYFRLKVFIIKIPPLRDRKEDIVSLTEYFLNQLNKELHKNIVRIPKVYLEALRTYDWPGNVRELQNVLLRAAILSRGEVLELDPAWIEQKEPSHFHEEIVEEIQYYTKSLSEVEKEHIKKILQYTKGNYGEACRILGVSRPTLRKKIRDYNIVQGEVS